MAYIEKIVQFYNLSLKFAFTCCIVHSPDPSADREVQVLTVQTGEKN